MTEPDDATVDPSHCADPLEPDAVSAADSSMAIVEILDRYLADLQSGAAPDRDQLLAAHPELADRLDACLAGIEFIRRATGPAVEEPSTLGEFRIIRELGRGGMGVVYEAEQTSLRRRVALKVLRFGAVADEEAMQRFRREAETVARLHHTHIVPIFAVGTERGVHYYAMQFIEGRSLADVLDESQRSEKSLEAEDVARWGLEAAEALTHAHQRGVIHRDIKPSNLLIDVEGVVWLTDFGLAKRADEATLTVSGALMGTPRYMSPEQAESVRHPVDHRTDVYSLGATLYELATGRPVFESSTAHGVIARILTDEPMRPRLIRPDLPRDLETIILTCLAKEPARRYQSARALAEDLRAVLDARPIRARRVPLSERALRYVQMRKKAIRAAAIGIAATIAMMLVAVLGWRYYSDWRLGRVVLTTDGPPLVAQLLPESGDEPIGEPFDVGKRTALSLPAGDYRLRLTGTGRLGQTYRMGVDRGETHSHRLSLDEGLLLDEPAIPFSSATGALTLKPGKADLIQWDGWTLIRRDGATGHPIWDAASPARIQDEEPDPEYVIDSMHRLALVGDHTRPGTLVEPAPDLDGDDTGDVVMAFARTPSLLAVSGKNGGMLWTYSATLDGVGGRGGRVIGHPAQVRIDGDDILDLVAVFFVFEGPSGSTETAGTDGKVIPFDRLRPGRRVMAAISGRTGRGLWTRALDVTPRSRPWLWDRIRRWAPTNLPFEAFDAEISVVTGRQGTILGELVGSLWTALDPANGRSVGRSIDLGFSPVRPVQYADLDGDGSPEVLALGPGPKAGILTLAAFSTATGEPIWQAPIEGFESRVQVTAGLPGWPMIVDKDGDGRAEVAVPDWGIDPQYREYRGVRLLDGATGQVRWVRPLHPATKADDGLVRLLDAPDLDGDGTRDLLAVSTYQGRFPYSGSRLEPLRIFVDALSGKDGRPMWAWHVDAAPFSSPRIGPPCWWGRGPDGWPMLAIPIGGKDPEEERPDRATDESTPAVVHVLAASTGREVHTIEGFAWPRAADLDGDGLVDLWGSARGKLRGFRAETPEDWRALGAFEAAADFDVDGITDLMTGHLDIPSEFDAVQTGERTAVARSGRDGRVLWEMDLDPGNRYRNGHSIRYSLSTARPDGGDVDGDGTSDVLVIRGQNHGRSGMLNLSPSIRILSGRSGRSLWSSGLLLPGLESFGYTDVTTAAFFPREKTGISDVLVLHGGNSMYRLARMSGADGLVVWDVPLAEFNMGNATAGSELSQRFSDLDGDGSLDAVLGVQVGPASFEWKAISLGDGHLLWSRLAPFESRDRTFPTLGDLDGDGRDEVILRERAVEVASDAFRVTAIDGRDGSIRWRYLRDGACQSKVPPLCLADFEGKGRREACLELELADGRRRVVILDAMGRERAGRDLPASSDSNIIGKDLDGDGRDELLFEEGSRLYATSGDLKEIWSRPSPASDRERVQRIIPAKQGRPATVVLTSMTGLDGMTGRNLWSGSPARGVLGDADTGRLPRLLDGGKDETICRISLGTTPEGSYEPARGAVARPGDLQDDPRWLRPLPWSNPRYLDVTPWVFLAVGTLAIVNVVIPWLIVRLATRRRVLSVRLLMALPVAVAIPLGVCLTIDSLEPIHRHSPWLAVEIGTVGTLAGIPVVVFLASFGWCLGKGRWERLAWLVVLTAFASVAVGAIAIGLDLKKASPAEHYSGEGWHLLTLLGAYAMGVLIAVAWMLRRAVRMAIERWRVWRRIAANPS